MFEKYGVPASRYADFAILRGDPSDELGGARRRREDRAALVETYESLDDLLADAAQPNARPGPLKGKPALKARILESADYIADMRRLVPVNAVAPLSVWSGRAMTKP